MTIHHHPSDELLAAYAAGTLDQGLHVAVATHLLGCSQCRDWMHSMEHVGGAILKNLPPTAVANDALARVEARLSETERSAPIAGSVAPAPSPLDEIPGLPPFVRSYPVGSWKWVAPRVYLRSIILPYVEDTRVFLLKAGSGTRMLEHTHTGVEITCVLSGSFTHDGGHFGPGDFDVGDETIDHEVRVDAGEDCICLVAMQGKLQLNGLLGRLVQPFVQI
jgi:putative transcriptional regulator